VKPLNIQPIGNEIAIKWDDGSESYFTLEQLRRNCPCASCKGEADIMGNVYKGSPKPFSPQAFQLLRINYIGGYAIQPQWADGHGTGIFSFDYLRHLAWQ